MIFSANWILAGINLSVLGLPSGPPKQIARRLRMLAGQNHGHHPNDPFAAFIHRSIVHLSSYIRHRLLNVG